MDRGMKNVAERRLEPQGDRAVSYAVSAHFILRAHELS